MSDFKPANMPGLLPYILVEDVNASLNYYEKCFNFTKTEIEIREEGILTHGEMTFQDTRIMFGKNGHYSPAAATPKSIDKTTGISLYFYTPHVDKLFEHAKNNGAQITAIPEDRFYGDRVFAAQDLDGYIISFAQWLGEQN